MITTINVMSIVQTKATATSIRHLNTLLDYLHTNPNTSTLCRKSDMIIKMHSDGSHLHVQGQRSRSAGHFCCGNKISMQQDEPYHGDVYQECITIKPLVTSATECGTVTLFLNFRTMIVIRITTKELGHPQPLRPTREDKTTTNNFMCNNLQQKKSKSFNMRLHWLRDQIKNRQFETHYMKGEFNYAEYYSKHHTEAHHKKIRPTCLASHVSGLQNVH